MQHHPRDARDIIEKQSRNNLIEHGQVEQTGYEFELRACSHHQYRYIHVDTCTKRDKKKLLVIS